jgi:phosphoribosylaminoimidazolecarboxamide formyltransferase/IMP cyclohydrolase
MSRALISVYNKTGIIELARQLIELGWKIVSSDGTRTTLEEAGIAVIPIEEVTGNPECFDGRMKNISFAIEGALLFHRTNPKHVEQARALNVVPIDLVVCNFYPFEEVVKKSGISDAEAVEMIDVGGPCMVRAAAKNFLGGVTVVVDPADYGEVGELLKQGGVPLKKRKELAGKAFEKSAEYEQMISKYFHG